MTPYYQDDAVTIYHADCREVLPGMRADVAITDPPYNLGIVYGDGTFDRRGVQGYREWCADWFFTIRESAPLTALSCGIANLGLWWQIAPPTWVMAWNKPAAMGHCPIGFNSWEPILIWGVPARKTCDAFTATVGHNGYPETGHPCPKPRVWGLELVNRLSRDSDVILDPFAGSGTVLMAAKDLGRKAIGIEIEERYCHIAAQRCSQEVLPLEERTG